MIRINLLPVRQNRKVEAARKDLFAAVVGGIGLLGVLFLSWTVLEVQLSEARENLTLIQGQLAQMKADVAKVEELEKLMAELQKKLDVIDDLRDRRNGPVHMMEELAVATPERLRLKELLQDGRDLSVSGVAANNETISAFLRSLDASAYFEAVYLQDIESTGNDADFGGELKSFRLTARTSVPSEETAEAAPGAPGDAAATPAPSGAAAPAAAPATPAEAPAAPAAAPPAGGTP